MRLFHTLRQKLGQQSPDQKKDDDASDTSQKTSDEKKANRSLFWDVEPTNETKSKDGTIIRLAVDANLLPELRALAAQEKVPVEQLTDELLRFAVAERRSVDHYIELWHSLTPREQETAALTCLGYTNRQIAKRMFISTNTVKTHVRNILNKFEIHSKAKLRELLASWDFKTWLEEQGEKWKG